MLHQKPQAVRCTTSMCMQPSCAPFWVWVGELVPGAVLVPDLAALFCCPLAPGDPPLAPGDPPLAPGDPLFCPPDLALAPGDPPLAPGEPAPGEPPLGLPDLSLALAPGDPPLAPGEPPLGPPDLSLAPGDPPLGPPDLSLAPGDPPVRGPPTAASARTAQHTSTQGTQVNCAGCAEKPPHMMYTTWKRPLIWVDDLIQYITIFASPAKLCLCDTAIQQTLLGVCGRAHQVKRLPASQQPARLWAWWMRVQHPASPGRLHYKEHMSGLQPSDWSRDELPTPNLLIGSADQQQHADNQQNSNCEGWQKLHTTVHLL